eukprot:362906-Rhodomonas_salina.1
MFNGKRKDFEIYIRLLSEWAKLCGGSCWVLILRDEKRQEAVQHRDWWAGPQREHKAFNDQEN